MQSEFETIVKNLSGANSIASEEFIQELWSGYGKILRVSLNGSDRESVIVKHIHLPKEEFHPRGWYSDLSRDRKLFSYRVETHWYESWSSRCHKEAYIPVCLGMEKIGEEVILVLEDLNTVGFPYQRNSVGSGEIRAALKWLAFFHASYMGEKPKGLWPIGTYWHLETRPDELKALGDRDLKRAAPLIDKALNEATYQTFVHGDAKLANFCFSSDGQKAAAVDFQYVGGGCGMKDVAYLVGSCLSENECEDQEDEILNYYFSELKTALDTLKPEVDFNALHTEWRELYHLAWTDFHRFLKGWSPGHWKINSYSERVAKMVVESLKEGGEL